MSDLMPLLFVGHGSPMNIVQKNDFTESLLQAGKSLPKPRCILCVSAHWVTDGTFVTNAARPKQIYDFYGFPDELYELTYPAPGSPRDAHAPFGCSQGHTQSILEIVITGFGYLVPIRLLKYDTINS